ncbi:MAG: hypothetical protein LUO93_09355 [Methanomicrobiales archaeon]|nr:hypothetical protein [Methanomicrobiales archaeon]
MKPRKAKLTDADTTATKQDGIDAASLPSTYASHNGQDVFAEIDGRLRRDDPDAFQRREDTIRMLFAQRHPGESLLRQETQDRSLIRYLRG